MPIPRREPEQACAEPAVESDGARRAPASVRIAVVSAGSARIEPLTPMPAGEGLPPRPNARARARRIGPSIGARPPAGTPYGIDDETQRNRHPRRAGRPLPDGELGAARSLRPRDRQARARVRDDHGPRRRLRRPLLPVSAHRRLEPRRGHRQVRQLQYRSGRRRARDLGRAHGVRLLGRYQPARAAGCGEGDARDRTPRRPQQRARRAARRRAAALSARGSARVARRHREGRAAREARAPVPTR